MMSNDQTQTYTVTVTFHAFPCSVCGQLMIHGLSSPNYHGNDSLIAQGAIIATTTPYYGRKYVCPDCAAKAPKAWCIGCKKELAPPFPGIYSQSKHDPSKCLCQQCYQRLSASNFDDLKRQLEFETEEDDG